MIAARAIGAGLLVLAGLVYVFTMRIIQDNGPRTSQAQDNIVALLALILLVLAVPGTALVWWSLRD